MLYICFCARNPDTDWNHRCPLYSVAVTVYYNPGRSDVVVCARSVYAAGPKQNRRV